MILQYCQEGEKVSTIGIENIARQFEYIKDCACIGVDDPNGVLGQIPILFIEINSSSYKEKELRLFLAKNMERYKIPKEYILLSKIPRNKMGKIERKKLADIWKKGRKNKFVNLIVRTILERRSIRTFQDKPISKEILQMILMAGYHAPTGHNLQSWRFTVLQNKEKIKELKLIIKKSHIKKFIFAGLIILLVLY